MRFFDACFSWTSVRHYSNKNIVARRPQVVRDVILSSKPKTLRGNTGYTCEKNGYSFVNAHRLQKLLRRICQLVAVSCKTAATSQIRELESLCIRQSAIMNWPSGNRSFALTVPTSTPTGVSRSAQFISHPTALSGPFIKMEHRDDWLLDLFLQFGNRLRRAVPYRLEVGDGWVNKPLTFPKLFAGVLVSAGLST